ncbi:hypothetical protein fugu_019374 [Takifugu bimaculatus]|uniref:Uncharacterized protein n=1 Tax=Takifugu bimaculatus TaxID=433685 RepID=A0A4Z2BKB0_9TELE|nr:hypothetical protein fugu_019374 [Takifugu bimaculatus]
MLLPSPRELKHLPLNPLISFHLLSRRFFTDVRRKHHRSHFLTQQLLRLPARAHTLFGSLCSSGSGPADLARQQVRDWKDERAININSPPRPPFCVLKYLIILGRLRCSVGRARADPFYKTTPVPAQ